MAASAALKADGAECADDEECVNACVSVPCDEYSYDDSGDCGGVCGELPTVDYEPDYEPPPECNGLFEDCSNGGGCCDDDTNAKAECLCAPLASALIALINVTSSLL